MFLSALHLNQFRNLKKTELRFDPKDPLIVFLGENGQGKTNILESIYLLAFSKSFRTKENADLMGFNADFCSIKGAIESEVGDPTTLDLIVTRQPCKKGLKVNGVMQKTVDFIGHLKVVFFSPDDLLLVHSAPQLRRRYLDMLLIQLDRSYLIDLMHYNELIKQRNALLRQIRHGKASRKYLEVWDEKVSQKGYSLLARRHETLKEIEGSVQMHYRAISQKEGESIQVEYQSSAHERIESEETFKKILEHHHPRDIEWGNTTIGPHRDDLVFTRNQKPLKDFGSRGEWRSLVLALKLTEIELLKKRLKKAPLLLLDDVFSELDDARQRHLFEAIQGVQTFVATTHREFLNPIAQPKKVYRVQAGEINLTNS